MRAAFERKVRQVFEGFAPSVGWDLAVQDVAADDLRHLAAEVRRVGVSGAPPVGGIDVESSPSSGVVVGATYSADGRFSIGFDGTCTDP